MNRISILLILTLSMGIWACSETKTEKAPEIAEKEVVTEAETADSKMPGTGDLYSIEVLKGDIPSPLKALSAKLGDTDLKIVYGSPSIKGRTVWGGLAPYGEVWRTGANENTTFEVSKDVKIGTGVLPAGKYGLFTIPGESEWTIIFNSVNSEWGAYNYKEADDVLRVKTNIQPTEEMSETMEFKVMEGNTVALVWEKMMVPFTVEEN